MVARPLEGSSLCSAAAQEAERLALGAMSGCSSAFGSPNPGYTCLGPGYVCKGLEDGSSMCTDCSGEGPCHKYYERSLLDPRLIESADEEDDGTDSVGDDADVEDESDTNETREVVCENVGPQVMSCGFAEEPSSFQDEAPKNPESKKRTVPESDAPVAKRDGEEGGVEPTPDEDDDYWQTTYDDYSLEVVREKAKQEGFGSEGQGNEADVTADPVLVGSGELYMTPVDLRFPGPVRSLEFRRTYTSGSDRRGLLGSNWTTNWEVRLEALEFSMAPAWASRYCTGWSPYATCLLFYDEDGDVSLFTWDPGTQLFVPQAGRTETIRPIAGGGYVMRDPDGRLRTFNAGGYLVEDRDRFGNGFAVELERTPLFVLYQRYCTFSPDDGDDDTPKPLDARDVYGWGDQGGGDPRVCSAMARLFGDQVAPRLGQSGWDSTAAGAVALPEELTWIAPHGYEPAISDTVSYARTVRSARAYLRHLLDQGAAPTDVTGGLRYRPRRVTDDLGRTLAFTYHEITFDANGIVGDTAEHGLLAEVQGPARALLSFSYDRPARYPAPLQESFLTAVTRSA